MDRAGVGSRSKVQSFGLSSSARLTLQPLGTPGDPAANPSVLPPSLSASIRPQFGLQAPVSVLPPILQGLGTAEVSAPQAGTGTVSTLPNPTNPADTPGNVQPPIGGVSQPIQPVQPPVGWKTPATLSGTVGVLVQASDPSGIDQVSVYAIGKASTTLGKMLGSSALGSDGQYLISFAAGSLPNLADLELYAKATDNSGSESGSEPVAVKTSNAGAPQLSYLVTFTLPPKPQGLSRVEANPLSQGERG